MLLRSSCTRRMLSECPSAGVPPSLPPSTSSALQDPATVFMGVPTMYAKLLSAYDSMEPQQQQAAAAAARRVSHSTHPCPLHQQPLPPLLGWLGAPRADRLRTRSPAPAPPPQLRLAVSGSAACPTPIMQRWEALSGAPPAVACCCGRGSAACALPALQRRPSPECAMLQDPTHPPLACCALCNRRQAARAVRHD